MSHAVLLLVRPIYNPSEFAHGAKWNHCWFSGLLYLMGVAISLILVQFRFIFGNSPTFLDSWSSCLMLPFRYLSFSIFGYRLGVLRDNAKFHAAFPSVFWPYLLFCKWSFLRLSHCCIILDLWLCANKSHYLKLRVLMMLPWLFTLLFLACFDHTSCFASDPSYRVSSVTSLYYPRPLAFARTKIIT